MARANWGVLGASSFAISRTIPALKGSASANVVAIASRDIAKAQAVAKDFDIPCAYGSYAELLRNEAIDAVYIPLANHLHFEWCLRALESGKHVLCEKPLCLASAQIRQLIKVRDATGLLIEEAFVFRNHPQWTAIRRFIDEGAIGNVRAVHGTMAIQIHDPKNSRNNPSTGGGALYDLGSYIIAASGFIYGRLPARVVAALDFDPAFKIDRLSSVLLDYGDAHATFTVGTQSGPSAGGSHQQLSILGTSGWLRCDSPYAQRTPRESHIYLGDHTATGSFETSTVMFPAINQYALQMERFSRLVLGEPVSQWPIEDALVTLRIVEAVFESAKTKQWHPIDSLSLEQS